MYYLQTVYAHRIRNKCLKSKDHEMNTTCRAGVQSGESKSQGLYTTVPGICVMVPVYDNLKKTVIVSVVKIYLKSLKWIIFYHN